MARRTAPWDRQPAETDPSWAAFVAYRDMGLDRSLSKVAQQLGKSTTLLSGWSSKHQWVMRSSAWDSEQDRIWQESLRHAAREHAEKNLAVANAIMAVVGNKVMTLVQDPSTLKPADLANLARAGLALQQSVLGQHLVERPGTRSGSDMGMVDDVDLESLTDEELRLHMTALARELESNLAEYDDAEQDEEQFDA